MSDINHIALAREFGAKISEVGPAGFGFFAALRTVEHARSMRTALPDKVDKQHDVLIARAFEEVRKDLSPDVVLSDPNLSEKLYARCRALGVTASEEAVFRRLIRYRKDKTLGIVLEETVAESDAEPGRFLSAAEIAWTQMSYQHGVSVDDLLVKRSLAAEFADLCKSIAPGGRHIDYVTAALYLRKTRHFNKQQVKKLEQVERAKLEPRLRLVNSFDHLTLDQVPDNEGVFLISERPNDIADRRQSDRSLFVGAGENLREAVRPFESLRPFRAIANHYWNPRPERIMLRVASLTKKFEGTSTSLWELKLIHDRKPLFNMPVVAA
jgi:hypothetical protein